MKNIILCLDGTESKFGPSPYTNLLKLFRMLDKDDPDKQICYYQSGVGTSMSVDYKGVCDISYSISNTLDSLIAFSLDQHIINAYRYLMEFYETGDKIYMFGFSRGGFTARVLSSMIERVGLLNKGLDELVENAWYIYGAWEYAAQPSQPDYTTTLIDEFKKTFARMDTPTIEFLGLFDCINSVGIFRDRMFPLTTNINNVKQIRHAVSLDERRGKYRQNLIYPYSYNPSFFSFVNTPSTLSLRTNRGYNDSSENETNSDSSTRASEARRILRNIKERVMKLSQRSQSTTSLQLKESLEINKGKLASGEFQEIWFPGNHSDIGGGWEPDLNGQFLSNLPLRWMFGEAIKAGVNFQKKRLVEFSQRYSSIDSMLSCQHDLLQFSSGNLSHKIKEDERSMTLQLSDYVYQRDQSSYFRSCEIPKRKSFDQFFKNGVYLNGLKRINFDLNPESENISNIFSHYQDLPKQKIKGNDGRGLTPIIVCLFWWLVEFLPLGTKIEDSNCRWRNVYVPNFGRARSTPKYAQLHWSVYWRLKYCYDYSPKNLPLYATDLIKDVEKAKIEREDENELLEKAFKSTKASLQKWISEDWKSVPDDLSSVLKEYNYYE